jgi:predicted peptidase
MPQCPIGEQWSGPAGDAALMALEETIRMTGADGSRTYLTGISMGGHGALLLAARHPTRFAAVLAVCGWGDPKRLAPRLMQLPIWLVHGAADPVVPVRCSTQMIRMLKSGHARDARYTEYPGVGHESWNLAYADAAMSTWLFGCGSTQAAAPIIRCNSACAPCTASNP